MSLPYPRRIPLANLPTPLQLLERASARWGKGHRLWVKRDDLSGCLLSGNKVRKLEFIAAHALDNGYDTLITSGGLQSNHCRATALVGAQLGLRVHLILRGERPRASEGNYLLDQLAGAEIECYPARQYFRELPQLFAAAEAQYAAQGSAALPIPTGGSDGIGLWGYIAACEELQADFAAAGLDRVHIVTATGSGGTQAGLTAGVELSGLPATVWGVNVCDDERYFIDKVTADITDWQRRYPSVPKITPEVRVLDGYVGEGYGKASPAVFDLIRDLARLEGVVLDPVYTGKAFAGLLAEIERGRFADCTDIVFMHTGGVFGVFPQSDGFSW
jgi:D-cysteine desulfhydrase